MIRKFESMVRHNPHEPFFLFVEEDGSSRIFSYEQTKNSAVALAILLKERGVGRRSSVSIDMPNCPAFVFVALAAAYGGFNVVALNHRLTFVEKESRLNDLKSLHGVALPVHLTERTIEKMLEKALSQTLPSSRSNGQSNVRPKMRQGILSGIRGMEMPASSPRRQDQSASIDTPTLIHFAEHARAAFSQEEQALIMFTSGTTGRPKAVPLTWNNLCGAAEASNLSLSNTSKGIWQLALPMFHIGGFEILVRSILSESSFILYRNFDAQRILRDCVEYKATHISVVDKMLQDLLSADTKNILKTYQCILLGGAGLNKATMKKSLAAKARVFASYGMTETSSQIANAPITKYFDGSLSLLTSYEAHIINPDEQGWGQLAVKGPGVFSGYLNARSAFSVDGFFLTGDRAALERGRLVVGERSSDMFVSGGENVYPAEIQDKLMWDPQVSDAFVFGVEDEAWGRRPVAFVERGKGSSSASRESLQCFAHRVDQSLEHRLSKLYRPQQICALNEFPRTGAGKTDRQALERLYANRIEIKQVRLYRIKQKLKTPFVTAQTTLTERESLIVEVVDRAGRTGLGECVAFSTDWYLPETIAQDERVLSEHLIPMVLSQVYLHPQEVSACLDECASARPFPLAKGTLEPAIWDLYGKIVGQPLWKLIGGTPEGDVREGRPYGGGTREGNSRGGNPREGTAAPTGATKESVKVPAGVALGIASIPDTLRQVQYYVGAGYSRIKLKIKPGDDIERVRAVRHAFPGITLVLDANQSYNESQVEVLRAFDNLNVHCIEEPLMPRVSSSHASSSHASSSHSASALGSSHSASALGSSHSASSAQDPSRTVPIRPQPSHFEQLAKLQQSMKTRICLDESIIHPLDLKSALRFPSLKCYALKIAKLGGIQPALEFCQFAQNRGIEVWLGGMYETSISKRMHAAFEMLPNVTLPGDISETARYFDRDIANPALKIDKGELLLNQKGYEQGLGCALDYKALKDVLIGQKVFEGRKHSNDARE